MALVTLKEILKDTEVKKYAVGMFDIINLEMTNAVIAAAEEERSPVILALAEMHTPTVAQLESIASIAVDAAKRARVPVAVHFDHGFTLENIVRAMHNGFSSVMFDGSMLNYALNKEKTREIVRLAKIFGASVEAELGHVGGNEGEENDKYDLIYTEPDAAREFVEQTGIDALAVSIGTVHGNYKKEPRLDLERLKAIRRAVDVPLVLHGGSGLSDQDFCSCIANGIAKVNIYTDIIQAAVQRIICEIINPGGDSGTLLSSTVDLNADEMLQQFTGNIRDLLAGKKQAIQYPQLMEMSIDGMKLQIKRKLQLFGSNDKA